MQLHIDAEFVTICRQIVEENKSDEEWAEIESDDMFESDHYAGGYDADEEAFCFSHYDATGEEHWFQVTLAEVQAIAAGEERAIEVRLAE